jgi:O-antigen ligase
LKTSCCWRVLCSGKRGRWTIEGVVWAAIAWLIFVTVRSLIDRRVGRKRDWLTRENIAVLLALLGTKSIASQTTAEEMMQDPVVIERVIRGGLAGLAILIGAPLLIHRLRENPQFQQFRNLTWLIVYLAVCSASFIYSVAPLVTSAKIFEMLAGFIAVAAAVVAVDGEDRVRSMVRFVIGLEASLLGIAVVGFFAIPNTFSRVEPRPGFIADHVMTSPFAHPNYLSATGALLGAYALARLLESESRRQKTGWAASLVFAALGTILASGRQGVVILAVSSLVLLWYRRRAAFVTMVGPAVAVGLWLVWEPVSTLFARGRPQLTGTLTGRVGWWESTLDAWVLHPWTGYGYGAGGRFVALANVGRSQTSNVHSGYLETLVGVGLLGFIPLMIAVIGVALWANRALRTGRDVPIAILIVPLLIHTSVAQGFGGWLNPDFVLLACLAGIADWQRLADRAPPALVKQGWHDA